MKKLHYWQRLQLRDKICQINIEDLSEEQNWELQGENLYKLGFNEIDAEYPKDTKIGTFRLSGWKRGLSTSEQHKTTKHLV